MVFLGIGKQADYTGNPPACIIRMHIFIMPPEKYLLAIMPLLQESNILRFQTGV
jgi:hypothetical protein